MKILVTAKRVTDPDVKIKVKSDGSGIATEGIDYKVNPFDEIAIEALLAGPRGTEVIERLVPQAAERLEPGGWLLVEISPMLEQTVPELIAASGHFEPTPTIKDHAGLARVVQAQKRC